MGLECRSRTRDRRSVCHHRSLRPRHHRKAATGIPPGWALAAGTAGALGHAVAALKMRNMGRTIASRAASWLVAGGWTTWAMATGPLSWVAIGSLATIGIGIGVAARNSALWEEAREEEAIAAAERQIAAELSTERRAIAAEWVDRVQRVCGVTLRVLAVEFWKTGTGFTIDAALPAGGTTWDKIAGYSPGLSADARLPHGCTASASQGIDQGRVLIDVTTVNVLVEERTYPDGYGPLSIYTGIPWGYRTNAEEICVFLREQCALVVGPTGLGKSNMVHVILAGFARTTDILTWVIDLDAASAGLPWVRPALDAQGGFVDGMRPGVDWLASTHAEALLMLDTALAIGLHRKVAYQDLMMERNDDKLPISARIPQIMLVIDEGAEILTSTDRNMKDLAKKILEVIRLLARDGHPHRPHRARRHRIRPREPDDPSRGQDPRLPHRRRSRRHGSGEDLPRRQGHQGRTGPLPRGRVHGTPAVPGSAVQELAHPAQPDPRHRRRHHRPAPAAGQDLGRGGRRCLHVAVGSGPYRVDARHGRPPLDGHRRTAGERGRAEPLCTPRRAAVYRPVPQR